MRTVDEKSLIKKKAIGIEGEQLVSFKYTREKKGISPEEMQVQALQNIATIIEQGLSQKTDYGKLILSIHQAIIEIIKQGNKDTEIMLKKFAENFKIEIPISKSITEIDVYKIERDNRGLMTGFKMKAKR